MLLQPMLTLTIPSIHDNTVLDCRIYTPKGLSAALKLRATRWHKKAAIVAHPYAPLGGCNDDPVVCSVTSQLLEEGFFVGTFNFRGAGTSNGRSSWTGKPEMDDYVSFVGFMLHFMHDLFLPHSFFCRRSSDEHEREISDILPNPSHVVPHQFVSIPSQNLHHSLPLRIGVSLSEFSDPEVKRVIAKSPISYDVTPLLLLAGYSYGALIIRRLAPLASIIPQFTAPTPGTAASEIRLRAQQLAKQQNYLLDCQAASLEEKVAKTINDGMPDYHRGGNLLCKSPMDARKASATASFRIGGEETDAELRRASHDYQQRSISFRPERLRESLDRFRSIGGHSNDYVRRNFSSRNGSGSWTGLSSDSGDSSLEVASPRGSYLQLGNEQGEKLGNNRLSDVRVSYLLISPPQGLVAALLTMWTFTAAKKAKLLSESERKLIQHNTLAVSGSEDAFSSSTKFHAWAESLRSEENSQFQAREVDGAGHFWREEGVLGQLRRHIKEFVSRL